MALRYFRNRATCMMALLIGLYSNAATYPTDKPQKNKYNIYLTGGIDNDVILWKAGSDMNLFWGKHIQQKQLATWNYSRGEKKNNRLTFMEKLRFEKNPFYVFVAENYVATKIGDNPYSSWTNDLSVGAGLTIDRLATKIDVGAGRKAVKGREGVFIGTASLSFKKDLNGSKSNITADVNASRDITNSNYAVRIKTGVSTAISGPAKLTLMTDHSKDTKINGARWVKSFTGGISLDF